MFKEYEDLIRQMELEMQRCSTEAMRRFLELPPDVHEFWQPKADVYETRTDLVVRAEIAGVERESLSVSLSSDGRILSLKGRRSESTVDSRTKTRYHQLECYFGSFERDILLPSGIGLDRERLSARYKDGFLLVTLPKLSGTPVARSIPISTDEDDDQ